MHMTVYESLKESKSNHLNEKEILKGLQKNCGLKLSEALEICKTEFTDNDKFVEAAFDIRAESLPSAGYMRKDGVTVVIGEWED